MMGRSRRRAPWLLVALSSFAGSVGDANRRSPRDCYYQGFLTCMGRLPAAAHREHQLSYRPGAAAGTASKARVEARAGGPASKMPLAWTHRSLPGALSAPHAVGRALDQTRSGSSSHPDSRLLWLLHSGRASARSSRASAAMHSNHQWLRSPDGSESRKHWLSSSYVIRGGSTVGHLRRTRGLSAPIAGGAAAGTAAAAAPPDAEIIKPERDERMYRYINLPNGLGVVLVSDKRTETAAASMFIRVGHMQDPAELAGMAHFHEHMLFLGTEKYPEEGDFENFLTKHGGSSNAYTAAESTNYYFDVDASQLKGATDRFAQFFQTPLFTASSLERELQAVDSEHSNNRNDDSWRLYQVLKDTANPEHAFSKFGSGNYETLKPRPEEGVDTRESLIKFHEKFYSADAMKLCVLGKEDLDTLELWVREAFSGVRNTSPPRPQYGPAPAFGRGELGRRVTVVPLRETRKLALSWPLPPRSEHARSKPTIYVSHLLGYEGEGGLHALLHGRGWISGLSVGTQVSGTDFQLFRLSVSLTEEGERHTDEIIELCYRFIALLKAERPQKRIQDDLAAMGEIRFRFMETSNPTGAVQRIANALGEDETHPTEVLSDGFTIPEWDPAAIEDVLSRLSPRNCQILVVSKKDRADAEAEAEAGTTKEDGTWRQERWYGTSYKVAPLPEDLLQRLENLSPPSEGFSLPGPNPFVPVEFGLRADEEERARAGEEAGDEDDIILSLLPPSVPSLALSTVPKEEWSRLVPPSLVSGSRGATEASDDAAGSLGESSGAVDVWHKMDRSYRVPRSTIVAKVWTPEPYGSPEAATLSRMFVKLLKEDLQTWAYDAGLADLRYNLEMTTHGLQLSVGGFSSKVAFLLSKILGHIGELLGEYRELGRLLESGEGAQTVRQQLLHQRFQTGRESLLRTYRNVAKEQPYETVAYYVRQVVESETWHIDEYQRVLETEAACTPAEMTRHFDRLLARVHVDVLAHGNVARMEAEELAPAIAAALSDPEPLPEDELPTRHALRLPGRGEDGDGVVVVDLQAAAEEEKNSAVQVYLQVGPGDVDLDLAAALDVINNLGYTSAFQQLRTKEQLGYIVYTQIERGAAGKVTPGDRDGKGLHPGGPLAWSVVVQSPDKTPEELDERIEAWISGFRQELAEMSDEAFEATIASMSSMVLRRERNMREEASIYFGALSGRTHDFYRRYRKAEAYRRLTKADLLKAFDDSLAPGAPGRRKLSVRVASKRHARAEPGGKVQGTAGASEGRLTGVPLLLRNLEEIRAFKSRTPTYE